MLTSLDFLRTVWPDSGHYCIATPYSGGGMNHRMFERIDAAAAYVATLAPSQNVYFAPHVFRAPRIWNPKHHFDKDADQWIGDWSVRTQANARACRVLFGDLDVGGAHYASQAQALSDLIRFVKATKLPRPMVVSSGGGLHVYWLLDRELASGSEWLTQATRLKQLAAHHKFGLDPARTTDQASVLRVAGTFNLKASSRRPVEVLALGAVISVESWDAALQAALNAADVVPKPEVRAAVSALGSNTQRTAFDKAPPSMGSLLTVCAQMRRLATLRGNNSEPEWYWGDIGVVKFTEHGRANVHKISSGYPAYSHAETDAKIDHWAFPPTTCEKLEAVCGPKHAHLCRGCPWVGEHSSPVWIAHLQDKAPPPVIEELVAGTVVIHTIPSPPPPYKRARTGGIEILCESKEGKTYTVPVYPYDLYPLERSSNTTHETEQQLWRVHLPHGVVRDFAVDAAAFVDDRALQIRLANNGVYAPKFSELRAYMSAYIQELQRLRPVAVQHDHLGWDADHTQFVLSDKVLLTNGTTRPAALSTAAASAREFVGKHGTLEEQIRLLTFFDAPSYVPNQFYMLASLGAPLFFATGHHGVVLHATGEAGASKSTALYAAASMWGPPFKYTLNGTGEGATALARNARRDILSNLPTCLDEITHIAADVAKTFAMGVTQPGKRLRLKQDGTPREVPDSDRASIVMTTANISLHSLLQVDNTAGTASSVRVFEIFFKKRRVHLPHQADAFLRGIKINYGWIGERFMQAVVVNHDVIVRRVITVMEELGIEAKMQEEERFWFAAAAATLVAGDIAVKLGLVTWNMALLRKWLIAVQLPAMRGTVKEEAAAGSPLSTITAYLEYINGDMVRMSRPHSGNIPNVAQKPRGEMLAHYDTDTQTIYVLKDHFRRWCEKRGQYSQDILKRLHVENIIPMLDIKRTLGLGTEYAKARSSCFSVDMSHAALVEVSLPIMPSQPAGRPHLKVVKP